MIAVEPEAEIATRSTAAGGGGKPRIGRLPVSYDTDRDTAIQQGARSCSVGSAAAGRSTPSCPVRPPSRRHRLVRPDDIAEAIPCGDSVEEVVEAVKEFADAGFTHVALCQIGGDHQGEFIEWWKRDLGSARCIGRTKQCHSKRGAPSDASTSTLKKAWRTGWSPKVAKEIAARTVNKERARAGEAREASKTSTEDISSGRRGGLRSHRGERRPHARPTLRRGEASQYRGPFEDVEGPARSRRRRSLSSGRSPDVTPRGYETTDGTSSS